MRSELRLRDFAVYYNDGEIRLIEYNGMPHYELTNWSHDMTEQQMKDVLKINKKRDSIKKKRTTELNIPLLVIPYWEFDKIETLVKFFIQ